MSGKKTKKKGQDVAAKIEEDKASKLDYDIASYMKKNTPTKRTKFLHHQVNYFYASKAVDVLLDSQWATGKDPKFTDRQSVVDFCNRLLTYKFFHRAKKIPITDKDLKPKELKKKREKEEKERKYEKEERDRKSKQQRKKKEADNDDTKKDVTEEAEQKIDDDREDEAKKKKKKIKLDMHLEQVFVDGSDAYVWMYDPVPFWYYIAGALCLLAAVAICLFPLWPPGVRKGVYYLSLAAAGFLGVILGLAVVRFVFFLVIWVLSMGRHHLWLLPNLTEDVGFFASFWPLYHYEYRGADFDRKKSKKGRKKVVLENPLTEHDNSDCNKEGGGGPDNTSAGETDRPETDGERPEGYSTNNASDSDNSQHSQPFEMVDREDVDDGDQQTEDEDETDNRDDETDNRDDETDNRDEETDTRDDEGPYHKED